MVQKVQESELVSALRARKRDVYESRLPFLSGGSMRGAVAFRVPTADEEMKARFQAAAFLDKHGSSVDPEKLAEFDLDTVWILSVAYVHTKPPDANRPDILNPAFGPHQLMQLFTPDQLGEMAQEVMDKRAELAGETFSDDEAESYRSALEVLDVDSAAELLGGKPKPWLMAFARWLCQAGFPSDAGQESELYEFLPQ